MGSFYTNIALNGPTREDVVAYLRQRQHHTYVSPTIAGITLVYDDFFGEHNTSAMSVAEELSRQFQCPTLWAGVADSDVFWYDLYENGVLIDRYVTAPDYDAGFAEDDENAGTDDQSSEDPALTAGDAGKLCAAFGAYHAVETVENLLARENSYVFEDDRHAAVAAALGIPAQACTLGYRSIEASDIWTMEGEAEGTPLIKTGD